MSNLMRTYLNEVIIYAGLPMRRGDAILDLKRLGIKEGPAMYAYMNTPSVNLQPVSLKEARQIFHKHN